MISMLKSEFLDKRKSKIIGKIDMCIYDSKCLNSNKIISIMGCGCKKNKSKLNETKRVVPSKKSPQFGVTKEKEKVIKLTESDLKNLINKVIDKTN